MRNLIRTMAHHFRLRGAEVTVVGPRRKMMQEIGDAGEQVFYVPNSPTWSRMPRVIRQSHLWLASAQAIHQLDPAPDVLLLVASLSSALGLRTMLLKSLCRKPLALYVTGLAQPWPGYYLGMSVDRIFVGSEFLQQWFPAASVISPFLPIHLTPDGATPKRNSGTFNVLFLGSLEPVRGVEYLLRAMSIVKGRTSREVRLIIAWNGAGAENHNNIRQLIDALDIRPIVDLRGVVNTNLVYREADIVVIPRVSQKKMAYPLRIPEAIHMHKPLVVTRVCGMEKHLEGCGLAVEPRDADALARAILSLAHDEKLYKRLEANCARVDMQLASRLSLDNLFNELLAISAQ